ncbi:hypothetical protein AM1_E0070 (plasmid) [Acaryochloris marina MBIC11017]|uniref:Uncharacterized protein n=1 Tax=Acaryochloris marina (strain MBIC 11017) TaxID=329726 RepID=A8ZPA4_ACAM1|nr:hypothetical protein AM1_E0070 [Acaryochloris marina MBIC11017]
MTQALQKPQSYSHRAVPEAAKKYSSYIPPTTAHALDEALNKAVTMQ